MDYNRFDVEIENFLGNTSLQEFTSRTNYLHIKLTL